MTYASFAELLSAADDLGSLGAAALARESADTATAASQLSERMSASLEVMRESIAEGLAGNVVSRSGLSGGDAARVAAPHPGAAGETLSNAIARSLAVAEVNVSMGRIVAAPTGGASGVLPGVLLTIAEEHHIPDHDIVSALFAASAIGGVIAARASLSGAAGGCQAEIGSAAAMAAAAAVELLGGTPEQAGHAASLALQGLLGLVCDPVAGLVEIPCIARNATGSSVALAAADMALAGVRFPIPFDEVVDAASHVGRSIPPSLRETARGGLAATPTAHTLAARVREARP